MGNFLTEKLNTWDRAFTFIFRGNKAVQNSMFQVQRFNAGSDLEHGTLTSTFN
jgi:hypothetical protein